jgi:hypothetical protein
MKAKSFWNGIIGAREKKKETAKTRESTKKGGGKYLYEEHIKG